MGIFPANVPKPYAHTFRDFPVEERYKHGDYRPYELWLSRLGVGSVGVAHVPFPHKARATPIDPTLQQARCG